MTNENGTCYVYAYTGYQNVVTIPELVMVDDNIYTVIGIGEYAFNSRQSVTEIKIQK